MMIVSGGSKLVMCNTPCKLQCVSGRFLAMSVGWVGNDVLLAILTFPLL